MKTPTIKNPMPIDSQVRKMKEDHAAKYGYDSDAIAQAAREWEAKHPKRMAISLPSKPNP